MYCERVGDIYRNPWGMVGGPNLVPGPLCAARPGQQHNFIRSFGVGRTARGLSKGGGQWLVRQYNASYIRIRSIGEWPFPLG